MGAVRSGGRAGRGVRVAVAATVLLACLSTAGEAKPVPGCRPTLRCTSEPPAMRCTVTPAEGSVGCGGVGEVELAWTPVHAGPAPVPAPTVAAAQVGAPLGPSRRDRVRLRRGLRRAQPVVVRRQLAVSITYELQLLLRDRSSRLTASERWFLLPPSASEVPGASVAAMHVHADAPLVPEVPVPEVPGTSAVGTSVAAEVPGTSGWRLERNLPALLAAGARRHEVRFDPTRPAIGEQR